MTQAKNLMIKIREFHDDETLSEQLVGKDFERSAEVFLEVVDLFRSAIEEVAFSALPEDSKGSHSGRLNKFLGLFMQACRAHSFGKLSFDFERALEYLELLSDNLELSGQELSETQRVASRREIITTTSKMIEEVSSSDLDELMRKALVIKLQGIRKISELAGAYSDRDLRTQIKLVMADVFAEWQTIEAQDDSVALKLRAWSGNLLKGSTRFLGLTADVSEIAGLLTGPK